MDETEKTQTVNKMLDCAIFWLTVYN